jgi:TRAP-type C4-dicarboxylate transport system substrate-binding protein
MNKQTWESLPKDVRDAIMSVSGLEGSKLFGKNFFDEAESGVMERVKAGKHAMNRYEMPPQELERWRKVAGEPLWQEWVKSMQSKGRADAPQVLETTLQLLKK